MTDFSKYQAQPTPTPTSSGGVTDFSKYGSPISSITTTPDKQPGYLTRVLDGFHNVAIEAQNNLGRKEQYPGQNVLRTAGSFAGSIFTPITEAPIIKPALESITAKIAEKPAVQDFISKASEITKKYPNLSKDVESIINITTIGAGGGVEAEGKAIGKDILGASKAFITPSEESIAKNIQNLFEKSIKPLSKKTENQAVKYKNDVVNALKTIKNNAPSLSIEDATGEIIEGRVPQTINELSQAVDQTKKTVFSQYDALAKKAGTAGATIDAKPIADEVLKVAQNRALQLTNPEIIKYAEDWSTRLKGFDILDTETTQEVIKLMNKELEAFYRNPTYDAASKVAVNAGIANNFRVALDKAIEGATGEQYQLLKNQYSSLKAIENDVVKAAMRDARKNAKGLLDYTDMFTGGQMVGGILSLNPAMFTKGALERGFKEYIKFINDPNRAIKNIFDKLESTAKPYVPQSSTGKFLQNPTIGLNVKDITKNISSGEKGTLRDFTDLVNGGIKSTDKKYIANLKRDATDIARKYGFDKFASGDKALSNQIGQYLDSIGFDKKITSKNTFLQGGDGRFIGSIKKK